MCLAIPGKVIELYSEADMPMGKVSYDGTISKVCFAYVPSVKEGEYALVHAGFAISILDEEEATKSLNIWREVAIAEDKERKEKGL